MMLPVKPSLAKRILTLSDIHLGHRKVKSWYIANSLNRIVLQPEVLSTVDAIFISGDTFDSLLNLSTMQRRDIIKLIVDFLRCCKQYKVAIRAVEGTPGHDWGQFGFIVDLNVTYGIDADLEYYTDIEIVEDKTLGWVIGYVQDEQSESVEQTTKQMAELMATRGYNQLDFIIMHGQFDFQVPKNVPGTFETDVWSPWAKYAIFIGHNHKHRMFKNIVVPGSFERLAHAEEDRKGFIVSDVVDGHIQHHFIENTLAMKFASIDGTGKVDTDILYNVEAAIKVMDSSNETFRSGFIKVKYPEEYDFSAKVKEWVAEYPDITFELEKLKPKSTEEFLEDDSEWKSTEVLNINRDNVAGMVIRELEDCGVCEDLLLREIEHVMSTMRV